MAKLPKSESPTVIDIVGLEVMIRTNRAMITGKVLTASDIEVVLTKATRIPYPAPGGTGANPEEPRMLHYVSSMPLIVNRTAIETINPLFDGLPHKEPTNGK